MRRAVTFIVAGVLLAACGNGTTVDTLGSQPTTATTESSTTTSVADRISEWTPCGDLECSGLVVPLDHADDAKGYLTLAVYRRISKQPNSAHIPLIIHPGGPGADVKQAVESTGELLAPLVEDFDVYGLSTRGTFDGRGFDCVEFLDDVVRVDVDKDAAKRFAEACREKSGAMTGLLGTRDTVEDLEALRNALGLDRVNFLGWSYGATVGATWALEHPGSIRSMVIDAPADPRNPWADQLPYAFRAGKRTLIAAFDACDRDAACRGPEPLNDVYSRVASKAGKGDLGVGLDKTSLREVALAVEMPLYDGSYQSLADALRSADSGDVSALRDLLFRRLGQTSDRHNDGGIETQIGVHCSDMSRTDIEASLETIGDAGGVTGFGGVFERICAQFPDQPRPLGSISVSPEAKSVKVMVVATQNDPIIPVEVSSTLATELGWALRVVPASAHLAVGFDDNATRDAMQFLRLNS